MEYNVREETGKFYQVLGEGNAKLESVPGCSPRRILLSSKANGRSG